jgi:hypothetical protein
MTNVVEDVGDGYANADEGLLQSCESILLQGKKLSKTPITGWLSRSIRIGTRRRMRLAGCRKSTRRTRRFMTWPDASSTIAGGVHILVRGSRERRDNGRKPELLAVLGTSTNSGHNTMRPCAVVWTNEYVRSGAIQRMSVVPSVVELTRCVK